MIAGLRPDLAVSPDDDHFHPVTVEDPHWIETVWFPFWIPEQELSMHLRIVACPPATTLNASVTAWGGDGQRVASRLYADRYHPDLDLADLHIAQKLWHRQDVPLHRYQLRLDDDDLSFDLVFESVMEPNPVHPDESPGMFLGHLEQPGRLHGRVILRDEEIVVDCGTVRDRSWGPRLPSANLRLGNAFGTDPHGTAFFVYVKPDEAGREVITGGYFLLDGQAATIRHGLRTTTWEGQRPAAVTIDARDALDRSIIARGVCHNALATDAGNEVYAVLNLVAWTLDSHPGLTLWGENHDVWSRAAWIAAGRRSLSI